MKPKKITQKTKISEILKLKGEKGAEILMRAGMGCVFCPMSQMESLEEGCVAHGMNKKEIKKIVGELNK
jgi:hybrid cluster-associated redox disulfide protein